MKAPAHLRYLYLLLAAVLPWSFDLPVFPGAHARMMFPAEIFMAVIGVILIRHIRPLILIREHKIALVAALWLLWGWVCALASALPVVSLKYMIVATATWWVFLLPAIRWSFLMEEVLPAFACSMGLAVIRIMAVHGIDYNFRSDQANLPAMPFFDDHNSWGAILSLLVFLIWIPEVAEQRRKYIRLLLSGIFIAGVLMSTSRGAMLSVAAGGIIAASLLIFKNRPILKTGIIAILILFIGWMLAATAIKKAIRNDVSMMERVNRYRCALRMASEKPFTGFGPGTYSFTYLAFQQPENMTRISLRTPLLERSPDNYGQGGGAHSEYFQALAETGWPGLGFLCLFWGILFKKAACGINFEYHKITVVLLLAALFTFLIHGVFNNFFHDPRLAFLIWIIAGKFCRIG